MASLSIRNGGGWTTIPSRQLWVYSSGAWVLVQSLRSKAPGDGVGPWVQVYTAYPFVAPTGAASTAPAGGVGVGTFTASNRRSDWRIVGSVVVKNGGGTVITTTSVDALSDSTSVTLSSVTPGTVEFTVRYFDPIANTYTAFATFSRAYTLPS